MKKVISGIFAGALCVVVLTWAFDAMGRVGHGPSGSHDAVPVDVELGMDGSASDRSDIDRADFADANAARKNPSRSAMDRLELTDDQKETIKTLRTAYARDMVELRAATKLARIDLNELMSETSPDVSQVKTLAAAVSKAQGSVFERGVVFRAEFKNALTPEQQETMRGSSRDRRDGRRDSEMRSRRGGRESRNRR